MNTSYEQLRADLAKRDKDNLRWTVGFGIAQIAITIAILGSGLAFLVDLVETLSRDGASRTSGGPFRDHGSRGRGS